MARFNEIQTELTPEFIKSLDKGVIAELEEILDSILFIYNLTRANRGRAIDAPHDKEGKVIVDVINPHILEDMDYFRQPAIHFERHKTYNFLAPNSSPNSDYFQFWKEETRRCRDGLIREYDGEWIPGSFYYYLNYSPILKSKIIAGTKSADRPLGFPDMYDGDYIFFHYVDQARRDGEHAGLLKRRGAGFSYKMGADLGRILKVGYNSKTRERVVAFAIASETEYLMKDGILSKFMSNVSWTDHHTPWPRLKLIESKANMTWKMGYKTKDGQVEGTENEIMGVTTKGDPDKARGKRGPVYWEEWGKFPNLLKSWEVARQSVQEGGVTFFTMIGGGTGGTEGSNFKGAEELFYNCLGYNVKGVPNVFDKNTKGDSKCGLFWGAYLNRLRYYDKDGNSDVIGALIEILQTRIKIRANSTDPNTLVQHKAEMPITPQEAIMRREGSIFPVVDLKDHLAQIAPNLQKFVSPHYVGHLKYKMDGKVEWDKLQLHPVLRDYPLKRDVLDVYGCTEIYQMPKRKQDGTISWGRYIAGIDPVDYDISTYAHSLGSVFIFDLLLDRIVAEYTGRPPRASEFFEQALRLLKFYNAEANYENNLKGLFSFFEQKKAMHYLCDTPQILKDMELVKGALYGNRAVGTHANKQINAWARKLQADWMISDAYDIDNMDEYDDEGNLIEQPKILNLQKIRSIAYLKEAIAWDPDDNYDRISAMGMLMILREDKLKFERRQLQEDHSQLLKDPWFDRFGGFTSPNKRLRYNRPKYNMKF